MIDHVPREWAGLTAPAARYIATMLALNLVWEVAQLPLYTLWAEGTPGAIAFAVLHCTGGDAMIASAALAVAILLTRSWQWPSRGWGRVTVATTLVGLGYTVFSEWLNVDLRQSWTYTAAMPRLPPWGTGLTPFLQWLLLPPLAMLTVRPPARPFAR
ncbi:hypothetical protein [Falsiroseomonas sp.]|uniref:hypothetical protein n=1 Tax=Falsiroseomonas sp. TaxID=2870721 RepID=UPI00271F0926|nr:hypothetical protein [Falsiroseomonas sp.]MDO9499312.1 hypothetical protein [Falsiroseomonas sp.]